MRTRRKKPYVPAELKRNPNSLTYLFRLIRTDYAHLSQKEFATRLMAENLPFPIKKVGRKTIERIEDNIGDVHYFHLEKLSMLVGVPSGLLLLFSRMLANRRDDFQKEQNSELVAKIVAVLNRVNDETEFDVNELRAWAAAFAGLPATSPHDQTEAPSGSVSSENGGTA
jgi:hypothetical protein